MKITKVRKVKTPIRGTEHSAGIDFFVPEFNDKFKRDFIDKNPDVYFLRSISNELFIQLFPRDRVLIPSGIHASVPNDYALIAFNKSGVSTKLGLDALACVVDADYQGEIHISLVNTSNREVRITENDKIIQFLLQPVFYDSIEEVESLEKLYPNKTERGAGGFGSTDKKE